MKLSYRPYFRTLEDELNLEKIVTELKGRRGPGRPRPVKPEGMSQEDFILSLQSPHAQRVMKMNEQELSDYRNRPDPENWLSNPDAKTNDESVGKREVDPNDMQLIEGMRRRGHQNTLLQSDTSSVTPAKRAHAIDAIIYTPPADVTKEEVERRAVNLVEYKSEPIVEEWKEMNWLEALVHWIKGGKVKEETKKGSNNYRNL